jgi:drug/metabolite transporter (DMT)-like permease
MRRRNAPDPYEVLREAVGGNRVLGIVMIGMGVVLFLPAFDPVQRRHIEWLFLAVSAGIFLLTPGILYQIAARAMKHREERAARMSMYVGVCQTIATLLAILVLVVIGIAHAAAPMALVLIPLLVNIFFVPATIVQIWKISRSIEAIRLLPSEGRAFEVSVRAAAAREIAPVVGEAETPARQ